MALNIDELTVKEIKQVKRALTGLGFNTGGSRLLHHASKNTNGPDMWCSTKKGPISIEIKRARKLKNGTIQVAPVGDCRRRDSLIAIVVTPQYVLVETMKDHLKLCSAKGYRQLTTLVAG